MKDRVRMYKPSEWWGIAHRFGHFPDEKYDFNADAFRRLLGPGVYFLAKIEKLSLEYLYIGSAKNLLARMSEEDHATFRLALCQANWVWAFKTKSEAEARYIEAYQIAKKQPRYNKVGKARGELPWRADEDGFLLEQFEESFREALKNRLV